LVRQCIEKVNTPGSSRKIAAVPSPWWTSRSTTSARSIRASASSTRIATATSLNTQNPEPWSAKA
jgi:hypothetical protein